MRKRKYKVIKTNVIPLLLITLILLAPLTNTTKVYAEPRGNRFSFRERERIINERVYSNKNIVNQKFEEVYKPEDPRELTEDELTQLILRQKAYAKGNGNPSKELLGYEKIRDLVASGGFEANPRYVYSKAPAPQSFINVKGKNRVNDTALLWDSSDYLLARADKITAGLNLLNPRSLFTEQEWIDSIPASFDATKKNRNIEFIKAVFKVCKTLQKNGTPVSPDLLIALGRHESGWGMSQIALTKNNWWGYGAYNINPNNAHSYSGLELAILTVGTAIHNDYLKPSAPYYSKDFGSTLLGMSLNYCDTDDGEAWVYSPPGSNTKKYLAGGLQDGNWAISVGTMIKNVTLNICKSRKLPLGLTGEKNC